MDCCGVRDRRAGHWMLAVCGVEVISLLSLLLYTFPHSLLEIEASLTGMIRVMNDSLGFRCPLESKRESGGGRLGGIVL